MATVHYPNFDYVSSGVKCNISMNALNERIDRAQYWLDNQIMTDMVPLMPFRTGTFINLTRMNTASTAGTGEIFAAAPPYGRFLYYGKVMADPETGSPWARKGAKKVVTDRPLRFGYPQAVPQWFEVAKQQHLQEWISGANDIIGGVVNV